MINRRQEERVAIALPIDLGGATGMTRDVSASGVFIETSIHFSIGDQVSFTVEFDAPGGKRLLKCEGCIVHIAQGTGAVGAGVMINESTMGLARLQDSGHLFATQTL